MLVPRFFEIGAPSHNRGAQSGNPEIPDFKNGYYGELKK